MEKDEKAILLGKKIIGLRESKGLSIRKLAKIIEISDTALAKIETGKTTSITVDSGKSIAKALGISFNELFDIELPDNEKEIELFKTEIHKLTQKIKDKEETLQQTTKTLELNNELLRHYEKINVAVYQQSLIIVDDAISVFAEDLLKIPNDSNSSISVPELKNKIMEQMRSKYIDFYTVAFEKIAGIENK